MLRRKLLRVREIRDQVVDIFDARGQPQYAVGYPHRRARVRPGFEKDRWRDGHGEHACVAETGRLDGPLQRVDDFDHALRVKQFE